MFSEISDEYVGEKGEWTIPGTNKKPLTFSGLFLGFSSSHTENHSDRAHPNERKEPLPGIRCSACRWSEFRLFREEGSEHTRWPYLIHFTGRSILPGEDTRYRVSDILTAREVIEELTTRKGGSVYLSIPAASLLAQAAEIDDGPLKEAYDARRVP